MNKLSLSVPRENMRHAVEQTELLILLSNATSDLKRLQSSKRYFQIGLLTRSSQI